MEKNEKNKAQATSAEVATVKNDVNNFKKINNYVDDPAVKIREKWMEIL